MKLAPDGFAAALALERGTVCAGDGVLAIPLRRGRGCRTSDFALISAKDRELARFYWSVDGHGYARRRRADSKGVRLHREVMGAETGDGRIIDHINRDKLDCRRENLRVVTQAQNCQNQRARRGSSEHRGVSLKNGGAGKHPWQAFGTLNGQMHHLGHYATEQEAAEVSAAWRKEHMPFSTD